MMRSRNLFVILSPAVLYAGILIGMHVCHSGWIALLAYHAGICLSLTLAKAWPGRKLFQKAASLPVTVSLVLAGLAAGPLIILLWRFMQLPGTSLTSALAGVGLKGAGWVAFALYYAVVNPGLEEIFWRRSYARVAPGWLSDGLYAGYHVFVLILLIRTPWIPVAFAVLCAIGCLWRICAKKTDSLTVPLLSHLAADISIVVAAAWLMGQ